MIEHYSYISPFQVLISFHKLIEGLHLIADADIDYRANYARGLLDQIKDQPQYWEGIHEPDFLTKHETVIRYLLADLFPTALTQNEIKAATIPFYNITFNYTERFKKILNGADVLDNFSIRDMEEHQFYFMNCTLILNRYYGQNIDFGKPLFFDLPDDRGIMKHYRILYNADFLEIFPTDTMPPLAQAQIDDLVDHYDDLALWKKAFPERSWILKGFAIMTLVDVTVESAISNFKSNLLIPEIIKEELTESFESIFESVFNIPDLRIGMTLYDEDEDRFVRPTFSYGRLESFVLLNEEDAGCKNALCGCTYENLIEKNQQFVISDLQTFLLENPQDRFAANLAREGVQSFLLAPVKRGETLLGLIEVASATKRVLNSVNATKLELILPYLSDTIEKNKNDMSNQLEAIVQREYTAIHPSVYWKFKIEAKNYFYAQYHPQAYTFKEIIFKEVYPLYGQIDIKGSSEHRNTAIVLDLKAQLHDLLELLNHLNFDKKIGALDQKKYELQKFLEELEIGFQNNLEQVIHHYIETEIHSFLKNTGTDSQSDDLLQTYFQKLDVKTGMFYGTRKAFDETITTINKNLAAIIDEKQVAAQNIFPHYYERFKTDGVEHNMYLGASIAPEITYNPMYLSNLRLWQLETLCDMEREHHRLKKTFPYELEVASLILVFSSPLSIRFRMDEKRFDVDGSYNARYEVVKKRIDKAYIKNSTERLTQQEKIAIVYSSGAEEKEYHKYIQYLQHKNRLHDEIEYLDVENLQGVSGLKALRVKVKHSENNLLQEAQQFITTLFKERLDCKYVYHNLEHTQNVVRAIEKLCAAEKIEGDDLDHLLLAGWFHDAGYIEGGDNHEERSVQIAREFLLKKRVPEAVLQKISDLILATQFDYLPKSRVEEIMKDADHAHLAEDHYGKILGTLREEWATCNNQNFCDIDWYVLNVSFLKDHEYYTKFAQEHWQNLKEKNLQLIETKLLNPT